MSDRCDAFPIDASRSCHVALPYGVRHEEIVNAGAEGGVADEIVELFENARRLVVDDRAVVALGLIEVGELLPHRRRARRLVDVVRRRLVPQIERHPRTRFAGSRRIGLRFDVLHLRRHVGGESFLEPEIVEPSHRHVVAEPVVRDLVVDRRAPAQPLVQRRRFAVDEGLLVEHRDAGMLHSAEREGRRQHVLELLEGISNAEVLLERRQRGADLSLERVDFHFASARCTDPQVRARSRGREVLPRAGGEGEEISGERIGLVESIRLRLSGAVDAFCLAVGDGNPARRNGERERQPRLEIRLIEAGKEKICVGRDEQRVEVVRPVLVVAKANDARAGRRDGRRELRFDAILAGANRRRRNSEVRAVERRRRGRAVDGDLARASARGNRE